MHALSLAQYAWRPSLDKIACMIKPSVVKSILASYEHCRTVAVTM
jgi:hypothetical protein